VFNTNSIGINLVTAGTSTERNGVGLAGPEQRNWHQRSCQHIHQDWPDEHYRNTTGVSGLVTSFGTNQLRDNTADGSLTLLVPAQQ